MIERPIHRRQVEQLLRWQPVVAILGMRQVGKTTLARQVATRRRGQATWFDLENPKDLSRLADPMLALEGLRGLVVIDEVQCRPDLFAVLRVLADRRDRPARFLLLGSAAPELLRQGSESLAGRIAFHPLRGFSLAEVGIDGMERLWLRGGLPRSFLAGSEPESLTWREDFIRTFLERDLPQLGVTLPAVTLRRFWTMLAHWHGQVWNASEFARSFGVSEATVRRYLDLLTQTFAVRQLLPWSQNLGKRQVKAPKLYLGDSGLLHALLGLGIRTDLEAHPRIGASWEGFVIEQITVHLGARPEECFFWATHAGAELDLLVVRGNQRLGFEVKRTVAPALTPSMRIALSDLRLTNLDVIHAGDATFPLAPGIRAVAATRLLREIKPLR